jgi:hypothetical protein
VGALAAALSSATPETLLAASRAQSYEEVVALVADRKPEPSVVALEPGQPIPHTLGSSSGDLVFTPITPCRVFDSRAAAGGWRTKVGPNVGNWFSVALADFTVQGGAASCPGLPTSFTPAAVALNLTSTGQTGIGNLRLIQCGGGNPLVSLLNYTPGVNLANAAIIPAANCPLGPPAGVGPNDIYVYSTNSASDVVVDIMGYYAAPTVTAVDNLILYATQTVAASAIYDLWSPTCPAGWRLTGGGCVGILYNAPGPALSRPVLGLTKGLVTGVNAADTWICQGTNNATAQAYYAFAVCSRVPGR